MSSEIGWYKDALKLIQKENKSTDDDDNDDDDGAHIKFDAKPTKN